MERIEMGMRWCAVFTVTSIMGTLVSPEVVDAIIAMAFSRETLEILGTLLVVEGALGALAFWMLPRRSQQPLTF